MPPDEFLPADRRGKIAQVGKVVACLPDDFIEVELASGEHKTWSRDNVKVLH